MSRSDLNQALLHFQASSPPFAGSLVCNLESTFLFEAKDNITIADLDKHQCIPSILMP